MSPKRESPSQPQDKPLLSFDPSIKGMPKYEETIEIRKMDHAVGQMAGELNQQIDITLHNLSELLNRHQAVMSYLKKPTNSASIEKFLAKHIPSLRKSELEGRELALYLYRLIQIIGPQPAKVFLAIIRSGGQDVHGKNPLSTISSALKRIKNGYNPSTEKLGQYRNRSNAMPVTGSGAPSRLPS